MKKLLIIVIALATTSYGMQPTIDIPNWITKQLGNITETISKNEAVTQTVKIMQQLAELQALYNQGVQTYNNVGNYSKRFKQMFSNEYWKNKLNNNLDWRNVGHLNQQLGIGKGTDETSMKIAGINHDLFGDSKSDFGWLENQMGGTLDVLDSITLQGELRNIASNASEELAIKNAGRQNLESAQRSQGYAEELADLESKLQAGLGTEADVSAWNARVAHLHSLIANENAMIAVHNNNISTDLKQRELAELRKQNRQLYLNAKAQKVSE